MPQHSITLESPWKRIRLVPPSPDIYEAYAKCRTHPVTRKYLGIIPETMTTDEARLFLEKRAEEPNRVEFIIQYLDGDRSPVFAGFSGYFHINEEFLSCEGGIIVHPDLHGKNIATETFYVLLKHIFEEIRFHRVIFITASNNLGMRGWLDKVAGAKLEGEFRDSWKEVTGRFVSTNVYAILEEEWRNDVKKRLEDRMNAVMQRGS